MTGSAPGGEHIGASLRSLDGVGSLRIEARLQADVRDAWSALTDPARLAAWYGEIRGDLRPGGKFEGRLFASGWEGTGRVEACAPPHRLVVVARDPDTPNEETTEVTLTADGDQTILIVEQQGPPLELLWAYGAGMQIHVEDLQGHLAGRERADSAPRFDALAARYKDLATEIS